MKRSALVLLLMASLGSPRLAAQGPGTLEFSALGVWHTWTNLLDARYGVGAGARLGLWLPAGFELEGQVDLTSLDHGFPGTRFTLAHFAGSLIFNVPPANGLHGYARLGVGMLDSQESCVTRPGSCWSFAAVTAAAGVRIPIGGALYLRGEGMIRVRPEHDYRAFGASVGLTFLQSWRSQRPEALVDSDRDGVADRRDRCPETQLGALVDSRGCPSDGDGDGVFDGIDRCPQTPSGTTVDPFGCPTEQRDRQNNDGSAASHGQADRSAPASPAGQPASDINLWLSDPRPRH